MIPSDQLRVGSWVVGHGMRRRRVPDHPHSSPGRLSFIPASGASLCRGRGILEDPMYHVLYDLDKRDRYILGGCVADLWLAVSAAEVLFPPARPISGSWASVSPAGCRPLQPLPMPAYSKVARRGPNPRSHLAHERNTPPTAAAGLSRTFTAATRTCLRRWLGDAAVAAQFVKQPTSVAAGPGAIPSSPPGQFLPFTMPSPLQCKNSCGYIKVHTDSS